MSWDVFLRFARVYNSDLLDGPPRFSGTLYARGSLRFKPADVDVPLLCDHDDAQEIGRVRKIEEMKDTDGRWYVALATVTEKPAWLKRGTRASFGYIPLFRTDLNGWELITSALVKEVTVTSASHQPLDSGARVLTLKPVETTPKNIPRPVPKVAPAVHRAPAVNRGRLEDEELRRRIDWCESTYGHVDVEMIVRGMRLEKHGPTLDELYADTVMRRRVAACDACEPA